MIPVSKREVDYSINCSLLLHCRKAGRGYGSVLPNHSFLELV